MGCQLLLVSSLVLLVLCNGLPARESDYQYDDSDAYDYDYDGTDSEESTVVKEKVSGANPVIETEPTNIVVDLGTTIRLPCVVDHLPESIMVMWQKNDAKDTMIAMEGNIINKDYQQRATVEQTNRGSVLTIGVAKVDDAGEYKCSLSIPNKSAEVKHTVSIRAPPVIASSSHSIVEAVKGMDVRMHCDATGSPKPEIKWTRVGKGTMPDGKKELVGTEFVLSSVTRRNAGVYRCTANNGAGNGDSKDMELKVLYPPEIEVEELFVHSIKGNEAELVCNVHAVPHATVTWKKDGKKIATDDRVSQEHVHSKHSLIIQSVEQGDFGEYTCHASNTRGSAHRSIQISGAAGLADYKSRPEGREDTSFLLEWTAKSYIVVEKFRLETREDGGQWSEPMEVEGQQDGAYHYSGKQYLRELSPATRYEARVAALNSEGWNQPKIFYFATKGAEPRSEGVAGHSSRLGVNNLTCILAILASLLISKYAV